MEKSLLRNRDFLLLSQGQLVNSAGTQIALAAVALWLKQSTDSASLVGLMTALSAVPVLLLAPLGGAVADRWSRRDILIASDVICGVVACALAILLQSELPRVEYLTIGLFVGNIILASAIAFTNPALNALIPSLVAPGQIGSAMAFSQASAMGSMFLGQFVGGMLVTHYAPAVLFWVDAATYFVSAGAEMLVSADVPVRGEPGHSRPGIFHDIAEGLRYVWGKRGMRALLLAAIPLNALTAPVFMLLTFYTANSLRQPTAIFGYLVAGLSLGVMTGYIVGGRFNPPPRFRHASVFGCVGGCATLVLVLSALQGFWEALLVLFVLGCLMGTVTVIALSAFIQQTEPEKRGRVTSVLLVVTQGLTPLTMSLVGVISDLLGNNIRLVYGGCGVLLSAAAFAMFSNRDLREFLRQE